MNYERLEKVEEEQFRRLTGSEASDILPEGGCT